MCLHVPFSRRSSCSSVQLSARCRRNIEFRRFGPFKLQQTRPFSTSRVESHCIVEITKFLVKGIHERGITLICRMAQSGWLEEERGLIIPRWFTPARLTKLDRLYKSMEINSICQREAVSNCCQSNRDTSSQASLTGIQSIE